MNRYHTAVLCLVLVLPLFVNPVKADRQVMGEPEISVSAVNNRVVPGVETRIKISLMNSGEISQGGPIRYRKKVKTARSTRIALKSGGGPFEVRTGPIAVGTVPQGARGPFTFRLAVDENAEPGRYRVPVEISYEYYLSIEYGPGQPDYFSIEEDVRRYVTVVVEDRATFEVTSVSSNLVPRNRGNVTLGIKNTGTESATSANVMVSSADSSLSVAGRRKSSTSIDVWKPGEVERISLEAAVANVTNPREATVKISVKYEGEMGTIWRAPSLTVGVPIHSEREFDMEVRKSLRVGREETITGTLTNSGPTPVRKVSIKAVPTGSDIVAEKTEATLGTLSVGETEKFNLTYSVGEQAEEGTRYLSYIVKYHYSGDTYSTRPKEVEVRVREDRSRFDVSAVKNTFEVGSGGKLVLRVENKMDVRVTDIRPRIFTGSPLSSSDDKGSIEELSPGEAETVAFGLHVSGNALNKTYPVSVDVIYDGEGEDNRMSQTYRVPVDVTKEGIPVVALLVPIGLVLIVGGVFGYRKFENE